MDAKRRMGEAMGRLLTKKPLKCISVEELVRESGVTRDAYDRTFASMTELAHYEFGAALASDCILKAMDHLDIGVKETELGADLQALGQKNSVVTIARQETN